LLATAFFIGTTLAHPRRKLGRTIQWAIATPGKVMQTFDLEAWFSPAFPPVVHSFVPPHSDHSPLG